MLLPERAWRFFLSYASEISPALRYCAIAHCPSLMSCCAQIGPRSAMPQGSPTKSAPTHWKKKKRKLSDQLASLGIKDHLRAPMKLPVHHNTMVFIGLLGAFNWAPIVPRDASLSDSYTSDGCCFPRRGSHQFRPNLDYSPASNLCSAIRASSYQNMDDFY